MKYGLYNTAIKVWILRVGVQVSTLVTGTMCKTYCISETSASQCYLKLTAATESLLFIHGKLFLQHRFSN